MAIASTLSEEEVTDVFKYLTMVYPPSPRYGLLSIDLASGDTVLVTTSLFMKNGVIYVK